MLLNLSRQAVLAELAGTALLVMTVVGSGISATRLSDDDGVRLLINSLATAGVLAVIIVLAAPISGAHFNPVVTLVAAARGFDRQLVGPYVLAQLLGAVGGTVVAHAMYGTAVVSFHERGRASAGHLLGEVVATAVLLAIVLGAPARAATLVPAWIGAAYFATSSTSFANPAVTIGRAFTDSFAGIAWSDVPLFVLAQLIGAGVVLVVVNRSPQEASRVQ